MTYQESLDYLYGLQKFGIKLGLENIRTFLSRLGHPEKKYKSVLVAGTNGKGSIASALAATLVSSGYRVGLYSSPHLHSFSERIRINGEMIPESRIAEMVAAMHPLAESIPLTFFEFTTALALQYFSENEVDIAILEVGLGGRLDATNAVEPILSVIAPVAFDHQQYLGDNLRDIALEKAGIMRSGVPVVSAGQHPESLQALDAEASKIGTTVFAGQRDFHRVEHERTFDYVGFNHQIKQIQPGVAGRHQFDNMATALAAAELLQQNGYALSAATMRATVENLTWPGRLEWLSKKTILLDGAHNSAAAGVLGRFLADNGFDNVHWIVGMKADKKVKDILGPIISGTKMLYCVEPPVEEAACRDDLVRVATAQGGSATAFVSIADALGAARKALVDNEIVLVAGSLFLVAAVRELIFAEEGRPCGK